MKRVLLVLCTLWAAAWFTSCGSSNVTNVNPEFNRAGSFEVTTEEGLGTFTPDMQVNTTADGAVVTISATDANELAAAYLQVKYDTARYSPVRVEFGSMLGTGDDVLTLALTDRAGAVPVGICQVAGNGASPVDGNGQLATVYFDAKPFSNKASSGAPSAQVNKVEDLSIIGQDATSVTLRWTETHPGDTDNNGEVTLGDLTNIGRYLNQVVADASDPLAVGMADCNGDGTVTVNELTTLGQNFGSTLEGYTLYLDAAGTQAYNNGEMIERSFYWASEDPVEKNHPVVYVYTATVSAAAQPEFVVAPGTAAAPGATTPRSNTATSVIVDGAPAAPTNLNALSGDLIGNGKIRLTWVPSPTTDVIGYEIERKTTNPDTPYAPIASVPATSASYIDSDAALTEQEYAYQIRAVDLTSLYSDYAGPAAATPFFLPPPSTPENFTAVTHPTFGSSVLLDWDAPADASASKFLVYRQAPGEPAFTMIKQTQNASVTELNDVGLTPLTQYSYYVTSLGQGGIESAPTPTLTATSSEEQDIVMVTTEITNGKTTHCNDGSEIATELTVTTNPPATAYNWSGPGVFSGVGSVQTWKPNASTPLGKNTLTVTAVKGAKTVQGTVTVYVTDQTLKSQYGDNGHWLPFTDRASVKAPVAPFRKFDFYADGDHVVLFNLWGTWCPPCRAELPEMDEWAEHYEGEYYHVSMNDFNGDTLQKAIDYFNTNFGTDHLLESWHPSDAALWHSYGQTQYVPCSILFDRDGFARLQIEGGITGATATLWNNTISQLTGMPPA